MMTLKAAFARSINTIAVQIAREAGIPNIIKTAHAMGIKTPLNETPAVSLGASDVSLLELVNAYGTVINDGMVHASKIKTGKSFIAINKNKNRHYLMKQLSL